MRKRKVISIVTAVAILIVTSCVTSNAATKYKVGDVNKDGVISINDVTLIQLYLSNDLRTIDLSLADFNGSGSVDILTAPLCSYILIRRLGCTVITCI